MSRNDARNAVRGSLIGGAIGDALGCAIVGNILGAWVGFDTIDHKRKTDPELFDLIPEIADDLAAEAGRGAEEEAI